ncbi:MAG: SH3 domain-containing protein [Anaerolineales bacterium]
MRTIWVTMRGPSRVRRSGIRAVTIGSLVIVSIAGLALAGSASAAPAQQPPTVSIATVTGTPVGPVIVVPNQVNVRTGPSTEYELIGVLIAGQTAPAIGRTAGGDWIQIAYAGVPDNVAWVYSPFIVLDPPGAFLPIIEPPPTATPRVTPTIDPTLAAQFNLSDITATRLPTFTAAPPIVQPTVSPPQLETNSGIPPMLTIAGLVLIGTFGILISVLRGS